MRTRPPDLPQRCIALLARALCRLERKAFGHVRRKLRVVAEGLIVDSLVNGHGSSMGHVPFLRHRPMGGSFVERNQRARARRARRLYEPAYARPNAGSPPLRDGASLEPSPACASPTRTGAGISAAARHTSANAM